MLVSYNQVFYSHYLYLHGSLSNGLSILFLIFLWFMVRMAYLCVDKFSKFRRLIPIFVGEGELSAK